MPADVGETFRRAKQRCAQCDEAQQMFTRVLSRLENTRDVYDSTPASPQIKELNNEALLEQATKFDELVTTYAAASLASRVIMHKKLRREFSTMHDAIDGTFRRLGDDMYDRYSIKWSKDFHADCDFIEKELARRIEEWGEGDGTTDNALFLGEALTTLRYARDSRLQAQWNDLAKKMLEHLAKQPGADNYPTEVPPWYIPVGAVKYNSRSFDHGSYGTVHLGTWGPGTRVVVKVLKTEGNRPMTMVDQQKFMKEADLWHMLGHPYVLRMFGACHVSAPPFLVCDYAENGNLSQYMVLENRKHDENADYITHKWRLLHQAALGVEYLHGKRIVHADLKIDNILIGSDTYAKVADFGISRVKDDLTSMTVVQPEEVKAGALRFRAPECFEGQNPSLPSDVYSFALCIMQVLQHGIVPYSYLDDRSAEEQIRQGNLPMRPADTPDDVWELIVKMTKKIPAERITMTDAIAKLEHLAQVEDREERERVKVCATCFRRLIIGSTYCHTCKRHVVATTSVEYEDFTIKSAKDIPRVLNVLTLNDPLQYEQHKKAIGALRDYVFGKPHCQEEVKMAGAMPILLQQAKKKTQPEILEEGIISTGCIIAGNVDLQKTAIFEDAIPVVADTLHTVEATDAKVRAAMVMGHLSYGTDENVRKVRSAGVMDTINELHRNATGVQRRALERALRFLNQAAPAS